MGDDVAAIAAKVREAMEKLPPEAFQVAGECIDEAGTGLYPLALETDDGELAAVIGALGDVREEIDRAWQICRKVRDACAAYLKSIGVAESSAPPANGGGWGGQPRHVTAKDGSQYPPEAGAVIDVLPRRVQEGKAREKAVGFVDGSATSSFVSGIDQTWTPSILTRADEVGISPRLAEFVSSHVEMKVAAMMMQTGKQHSELVINHVPCGSQPGKKRGCDQVLERFLPKSS
ncbi:DddA-like double-stranded DNA deaminase toxin [Saccharopolyspora shandongensis]|uniref:DddA-like double-stranded DNA deaminase toxin n=1 Tax=Saccharopolyspora shandongensis TaxID=418495 RepID=UPI0034422CF6